MLFLTLPDILEDALRNRICYGSGNEPDGRLVRVIRVVVIVVVVVVSAVLVTAAAVAEGYGDSAVPVAVPIAIAISIAIAIAIPIAVRFGNGVSCSGLTFSHTLWWICRRCSDGHREEDEQEGDKQLHFQ